MKHFFSILFIITSASVASAQCQPQQTISDDFESYTAGSSAALPTCWASGGSSGQIIGTRNTAGESHSGTKYISIYTFFTANATTYIISPELSSINGNYSAQFFVSTNNSDVTLEYGTMSSQTTVSTFSALSTASLTANAYTQITTGNIPAISGHKYFAMKFTAPTMHSSIKIDDFSWTGITTDIANYESKNNAITIYPNPSNGGDIKIISNDDLNNYKMTVYNSLGQKTIETEEINNVNTSTWQKGLYTIQLQKNNSIKTLKLVVE